MERNPSVQVCLSVQKACVRRYAISRVFDGQRCVRLCRCPTVQMGCDGAEGVQLCRWGVTVQRVSSCADGV